MTATPTTPKAATTTASVTTTPSSLQPRERARVLDRLRRAHRRAPLKRAGVLAVQDGDPLTVRAGDSASGRAQGSA
jgi:hypothetical protein